MNTEPIAQQQITPDNEGAISTATNRHRRGHVARLPKVLRDKINSMLDDGAAYSDIITELQKSETPALPYPLTEAAIGSWKNGGYQDYLRNRSWRERIDARAERFLEVAADDPTQFVAGGLYSTTVQLCEIIDAIAQFTTPGETDVDRFARMTHELSRLSRCILNIEQHRDAQARAKAVLETPEVREARQNLVAKISRRLRSSSPWHSRVRIYQPIHPITKD